MSEELSTHFGVEIKDEDLRKNPKFARLLQTLKQHLQPTTLIPNNVKNSLDQKRVTLEQERQLYYQNLIPWTEIKQIAKDNQHDFKEELSKIVYIADMRSSLPSSSSILGIKATPHLDELEARCPNRNEIIEFIHSELRSRLINKCYQITQFMNPDKHIDIQDCEDGVHINLSNNASDDIDRNQRVNTDVWFYIRTLSHCVEILADLIQRHKLQNVYAADKARLKYFDEQQRAMKLKLRVLKYTLINDTYDSESIAALRIIREHLNEAYTSISNEISDATRQLERYESQNQEELESIAEEYRKIMDQIEDKRWTLDQLAKGDSSHIDRITFQ